MKARNHTSLIGARRTALALSLLALLQACASAPAPEATESASAVEPAPVPELNLNLPGKKDCHCEVVVENRDQTFLERGYNALSQGEPVEAVTYFQRYQRLESSPEAEWEAGIGIAFASMLPNSPFYDPEASRKSWRKLNKKLTPEMRLAVHPTSLLMRDALESFAGMEKHIAELEANNATLKEDLEKREEALKRLRELTLGQRGGRQ